MLLLQHRHGLLHVPSRGLGTARVRRGASYRPGQPLLFVVTVVVSDGIVTVVFILRASMPEAERSIGEFLRIRRVSRGVSR